MSAAPDSINPPEPDRLSSAALAAAARAAEVAAEHLSLRADIAALVEASAVLTSVLAASGDCIKILDLDGRIQFINEEGYKLLEATDPMTLRAKLWIDLWPNEPTATAALAAARAGRDAHFSGSAPTFRGSLRQWDVRVKPVLSTAGVVMQILVVSRDITEQHRLSEQRTLLASELEHRIKNLLAMVAAIAQQTIRAPATIKEAADRFAARVQALGRAQSILTRTNWTSADIRVVVDGALEPLRVPGSNVPFEIDGPLVALPANRALNLVLALHELATNAAKYGALSCAEGRVRLHWRTTAERMLIFEWQESGGPTVTIPARTGFGSKLLQRVLAAEFDGRVRIDYASTGVTFMLTAPLDRVAHGATV